jgi:hypothetical protein
VQQSGGETAQLDRAQCDSPGFMPTTTAGHTGWRRNTFML